MIYDYAIRHSYDDDDDDYIIAVSLDIKFIFPILFFINLVIGINSYQLFISNSNFNMSALEDWVDNGDDDNDDDD